MGKKQSQIRVICHDEIGTSRDAAEVLIYEGERKLIYRVVATIEYEQGADGGYYACVKLKQEKLDD